MTDTIALQLLEAKLIAVVRASLHEWEDFPIANAEADLFIQTGSADALIVKNNNNPNIIPIPITFRVSFISFTPFFWGRLGGYTPTASCSILAYGSGVDSPQFFWLGCPILSPLVTAGRARGARIYELF
ncbi:MAG: hypothetical protein AABW68_03055, partial [archaeon]